MSFAMVVNYLLIIFISLVNGMPQKDDTEKSGALPFLQFTDGGIRVNFGGYHAEAGLGGLLRGTGGGLYAKAGTPWGAHAGAGLGGQVGDTLGGGLYARAGLGRGGPDAAAGLGGRLDGRSANPIAGGLYAGATPGGGPGTGVFLGGGADQVFGFDGIISGSTTNEAVKPVAAAGTVSTASASADAAANVTKPTKGRTNIQIIPSKGRKEKEKLAVAADATVQADAPAASEKTESQDKETRRAVIAPAAEVGLVKSVYFGAAPAVKTIVIPESAAAVPAQGAVQATATDTTVANNPSVVVPKPVYPRWYFRKRFRTAPRKTVYVAPTSADTQSSPSEIVGGLFAVGDGEVVAGGKAYASGSLFDDIFNIPISTLSAVNQLLRNNVG
ncbi:uncharacterized protein LOC105837311 [Monomorium pharaonis]|uniref:uncharacterized protein LOC105837311 n=1 Tax=Monomorium pharaonis TaxID=307658 RepID=UPI00063F438C|nr:uncharacterized protein LOC105837311 [Monomorium pharaonis]